MSNKDRLIETARRNPSGLRFGDFQTMLKKCGWTFDHQTGSHGIWYSPQRHRISIQEARGGKAKGYQVRQFLEQYEREAAHEE